MQKIDFSGLNNKLNALSTQVAKNGVRAASKKSMEIVKQEAIQRSRVLDDPETPNDISEHVAMVTRWDKQTGSMLTRVGIDGGASFTKGDKQALKVTYWRFVELGTEHSQARPFLRPALKNNTAEVMQQFIAELTRQLDRKISLL